VPTIKYSTIIITIILVSGCSLDNTSKEELTERHQKKIIQSLEKLPFNKYKSSTKLFMQSTIDKKYFQYTGIDYPKIVIGDVPLVSFFSIGFCKNRKYVLSSISVLGIFFLTDHEVKAANTYLVIMDELYQTRFLLRLLSNKEKGLIDYIDTKTINSALYCYESSPDICFKTFGVMNVLCDGQFHYLIQKRKIRKALLSIINNSSNQNLINNSKHLLKRLFE